MGDASTHAMDREAERARTRVLFLGNSYTYFNNLPAIVMALAEAGTHRVEATMAAPGGWRLKDHLEKGEALSLLRSATWDAVVLQEQSTLGTNLFVDGKPRVAGDEAFQPWAERWAAEITRAGATPVFYLTWARKASPIALLTSRAGTVSSIAARKIATPPSRGIRSAWILRALGES